MSIKRNPLFEPQWGPFEYASLSNNNLFSNERWGKIVDWDVLLKHTKQIKNIVSLLVMTPYPTRLFLSYIDILEANLYIFHDLFYYLTGGKFSDGISNNKKPGSTHDETWNRLQFWNIDGYKTIRDIACTLDDSYNFFCNILQRNDLRRVKEMLEEYCEPQKEDCSAKESLNDIPAYRYIGKIYYEEYIDEVSFARQIDDILIFLSQDSTDMHQWAHGWYSYCFLLDDFNTLLEEFVSSEKGQKIIKGWEYELNGTRENLIASLERDKKFQPWVYRYCHIGDTKNIIEELFDDKESSAGINYDELNKTDNWLSLLSIAAILKEYDERHKALALSSPPKTRAKKVFREFVIDADSTDEIIGRRGDILKAIADLNETLKITANKPTTQIHNTIELVSKKETNIGTNYGPNIENNGALSLPNKDVK